MNPLIGWSLALVAFIVGGFGYGWPGVALAGSGVVFWLMLQFNRTLRVLRDAGSAPVGKVPSAVMFHAALRKGLLMMKVVAISKSLGKQVSETPEVWSWKDDSDAEVRITFVKGRVESWQLERLPAEDLASAEAAKAEEVAPAAQAAQAAKADAATESRPARSASA